MKRLTKDNYVDDWFRLQDERNHYPQAQYKADLWNKVKSIEDFEEELGIDLITLFKASVNGIFVEEQNTDEKDIVFEEVTIDLVNKLLLFRQPRKEIGKGRNISQYGKIWALTREELENDR